jgi:hypothetical protein
MFNRFATLAAVCVLAGTVAAPVALAEPDAPAPEGPAGPVPSGPPGVLRTPDGWTLTVSGSNESLESVAPLTGSIASREYLVDGTFTGAITGGGSTKLGGGSLEAGYQIGCGILQDDIESISSLGITPGLGGLATIPVPSLSASLTQQIKIVLKPGTVNIVPIDKKSFKGTVPRIQITGLRVKFDQCAGQSFIRSYATLTSSTDNTDDVITYIGVTKVV